VLKSGVHATLAGVALALFIPRRPARRLEHDLHPPVAYGVLPLFAFANAGVPLAGVSVGSLLAPVPLGIAAGLLLGKLAGVFLTSFVIVRLGVARLPVGASWSSMLGVAALCGVGFTMSLFIGMLAFPTSPELESQVKVGVLLGSTLSAIVGAVILLLTPCQPEVAS
jgi:NhaA family Na+:H+ antiporter